MKKTAITISMMNHQNGEQRMTSTEIAELTGKNHKDVLKAIRKMEPAWGKVNGRNFALVEYRDQKGELRPCYSLSKIETLYIATKFNDEARARLVIRWEQLEHERLVMQPMPKKEIRLLACDEEVQALQLKAFHNEGMHLHFIIKQVLRFNNYFFRRVGVSAFRRVFSMKK